MGINLFENPNFPEDKIARLKQGEMVVFDCNYEFDNIQTNEYYNIDPKRKVQIYVCLLNVCRWKERLKISVDMY